MSGPTNKGGRPKGPVPTQNDILILLAIAKDGFQTYRELRAGPLKQISRAHSWVVMKRLTRLGILRECIGDGGGIRGWTLSPTGQRSLQGQVAAEWMTNVKPPKYRTSFDHDVVLREIKAMLCNSPAVSDWTPEHVLKAETMAKVRNLGGRDKGDRMRAVPDAIFKVKHGTKQYMAALELELTQKSKKRLFERFEAHVTNPQTDFSFFIVKGQPLLDSLWKVYRETMAKSFRVKLKSPQNGIYFCELGDLQAKGLSAKFTGLRDSIRFADLGGVSSN